jgi:excinuclease ABC subunit C
VKGADDVASIKEILSRRLNHKEWPYPDLILIDGGKPQVNAAKEILASLKIKIPVIGIAKGPKRDKNDIIMPDVAGGEIDVDKKILIRLRDEAHRFAIAYYRLTHLKKLKNS